MPHPTAPCLNEGVAVWRIQRCAHVGGNHPATLIPGATDPESHANMLVGGFNPSEKYESQLGLLFHIIPN
jgi:hypothetical protein